MPGSKWIQCVPHAIGGLQPHMPRTGTLTFHMWLQTTYCMRHTLSKNPNIIRCGVKMGCEFSINISKSMPKSEQACLKLVKLGFSIFKPGKIRITQITCASHLLCQMLCPVSKGLC